MSARLAVFASGGGRSLENLAEVIARGELEAELALLVCNSAKAGVLTRAERLGIPRALISQRDFEDPESYGGALFEAVEGRGCELVVLAGFLRLVVVPERWLGRVLNIHPSLLPAFGGKGFYGERVHRAVLERGVQFTGCTVHYVTNEYDAGPILLQRCVEVDPADDADSLAARVFEAEKLALPEAIRRHLSGAVRLESGRVLRTPTGS